MYKIYENWYQEITNNFELYIKKFDNFIKKIQDNYNKNLDTNLLLIEYYFIITSFINFYNKIYSLKYYFEIIIPLLSKYQNNKFTNLSDKNSYKDFWKKYIPNYSNCSGGIMTISFMIEKFLKREIKNKANDLFWKKIKEEITSDELYMIKRYFEIDYFKIEQIKNFRNDIIHNFTFISNKEHEKNYYKYLYISMFEYLKILLKFYKDFPNQNKWF